MKLNPIPAICGLTLFLSLVTSGAEPGVLDLTSLANYASQPVPSYVTHDNTPPENPITDAGATLGRVLFYDVRLSRNNTISCSSCHDQSHAFSDANLASGGVAGTTGRHSMRLINTRFAREKRFFWDERAPTLEHQTTQPIQDHVEMGFSGTGGDPDFATLIGKLSAIPEYRVLFSMVFGDASITEARIQKSIAQFVRSIQSFDSKYDAGRANAPDDLSNFENFTAQENAGKLQFMRSPAQGGAGCAACHVPPTFEIDPASGNNGVIGRIGGGQDLTNTRAPSLRDLLGPGGPNGPFMHDGSITGLGQITNHYRRAIPDNPNLDPRLRRPALPFRNNELAPLRAFLHTLTGTSVYNDPKWSSPFDEGGQLRVIVLPFNAIRIERNSETPTAPLVLRGQLAPNLDYRIEASALYGDRELWETLATVRSDANGLVEYALTSGVGKMFYRFVYEVPTE